MWSRPVAGARWAAQTSAASPTAIARLASPPAATCSGSVSKRARSAASRSGSRAAARPRRSRIVAAPPAGRRNSDAGSRTALWIAVVVRWSVGSNERNESISSPKNSIRIGRAIDGGKTSTIPPRRADSPRPATSLTGTYPRSNSSRSSASWWSRDPTRSSRGARGRSAGSIVCWRSDWTPATRIRARPFCHAASAATRAAVSSAISSLRSYASAVRGSRTATASGSPSQAPSSSATRSAISASRAIQTRRSPTAPWARVAARYVFAPCGTETRPT